VNRHIGYDKAAAIAKKAHKEKSTLRAAALALGLCFEANYDGLDTSDRHDASERIVGIDDSARGCGAPRGLQGACKD